MKLIGILRVILTLALLGGVYTETGVWTTVGFFLIFLGFEAHGFIKEPK